MNSLIRSRVTGSLSMFLIAIQTTKTPIVMKPVGIIMDTIVLKDLRTTLDFFKKTALN